MNEYNEVRLAGQIVKTYPLKYTLQKIPVVSFVVEHKSMQIECEHSHEIKCRMYCIYLGGKVFTDDELLDEFVYVTGFLSHNAKSQLVLHIKTIEFLDKGN